MTSTAPTVEAVAEFPAAPDFVFGTATAATQIEGGCSNTDWAAFAEQPGRIADGSTPSVACDSWERWREDLELSTTMNLDAYRLSIEWGRLEPENGVFDRAAFDRYREQLGALVDAGIEPAVTLHHFSIPRWLMAAGGLACAELPHLLERFTRQAAKALGDLVPTWVTINEPNVATSMGYLFGDFPPGKTGAIREMVRAQHLMLEAHARMYRALHDELDAVREIRVGAAHHLRLFGPARPLSMVDRVASSALQALFNDGFAGAVSATPVPGRAMAALNAGLRRETGYDAADAAHTQDFFGLNYYTRDLVRISPREGGLVRDVAPGAEVTDLGWEVIPEGIGTLAEEWNERSGVEVLITENGCADATDTQRPSFLVRHLKSIADARARGANISGYFHWSLLDNWEWAEGFEPRFGLVAMDYNTGSRRIRDSGRLYADIAKTRRLSAEHWRKHRRPPATVARHPR